MIGATVHLIGIAGEFLGVATDAIAIDQGLSSLWIARREGRRLGLRDCDVETDDQ